MKELLLHYIDECMGSMGRAPAMWGSPESLELQALQLFELRTLALRPTVFQSNHREAMTLYRDFVAHEMNESPSFLLSSMLAEKGRLSDLPRLIGDLYTVLKDALPPENPFECNDLVLEIAISKDAEAPNFSTVCGYYERFQKALRNIGRHTTSTDTNKTVTVAEATEYPIPEIRVLPQSGGGSLIQIPFAQPKLGQRMLDGEFASEERARSAIESAIDVATWAEEDKPSLENLRTLFPGDKGRKSIAAHTIKMLPGQGIEEVRVGGRLLGVTEPVVLRATQALRIVPVLQEGETPKPFAFTGTVRAIDLDQKWFRLKYGNTTIRCWASNAPEQLDMASKALASKAKVRVEGEEFRPAYRRPFVMMKDLAAA